MEIAAMNTMASSVDRGRLRDLAGAGGGATSACPPSFVVEEFTPVIDNTLVGLARVRLPSGLILHDVAIHKRNGTAWAVAPSKPMLDRNGVQVKNATGKPLCVPIVTFASRELRDRFSAAVIDAVRAAHPRVLDHARGRAPWPLL
jgi:hypothetical protein